MLRASYFGKITSLSVSADDQGNYYDQTFSAQGIVDLSLGYTLNRNLKFSLGGSNILDKYPQVLRAENRGFTLYSSYQQGSNGAYYYGRVMFNF